MGLLVRGPVRRRQARLLLVAAAALAGGALLAGPAAGAGPAGTVTFTGGCGLLGSGLGGTASPDAKRVNLPAGTGLRFANQLGQSAALRLDGEEVVQIPAGGSADVIFHDGPVLASMQISCLLGEPANAVTVEVSPAARPEPAPSTSSPSAAASPQSSGGSGSTPDRTGAPDRSPVGSPDAAPAGSPAGGPAPHAAGAPAFPGGPAGPGEMVPGGPPPADFPAPTDGLSPRWGLATDQPSGGGSGSDPATVDPQAAGGEAATGELARTAGSTSGDGSVGLLALVATVCVVGVSAGAIRAIIGLRATRTELGLE
jgi:hypothetical protein